MTAGIGEIFGNFIILRIYLPGLMFLTLFKLSSLSDSIPFSKSLGESDLEWIILPIVLGQLFHLVTGAFSLVFGFEQIKDMQKTRVSKCVQSRVNGGNIYVKDGESAKKMFHFGQLYANSVIALLLHACLNWKYGPHYQWSIASGIFFLLAVICSFLNYQYGRAVLAHKDFKP
jgi:hypothetical protein